jgi:predicted LPLAT superfamily acyltransferase
VSALPEPPVDSVANPVAAPAPAEPFTPPRAPRPLRDAREVPGALPPTDWANAKERSNALAIRLMAWIAMFCGRGIARLVLHPITLYFLLFAPTPRRHSARYLGRALGRPARWRDLYRHFHAFAATVLDRVYLLRGRLDLFDIQHGGEEKVFATLGEGRGAFLLGAHIGSFEAMHAVAKPNQRLRMAMIMFPDNARLISSTLASIAPDYKPQIIPLGRIESTLVVRDWLDGGGLAGMLGDRSLPMESQRVGVLGVPFLGREAYFSDGPFRLATLLKRRVFFMVGLYEGGKRYDVRIDLLADFSERLDSPEAREQRIRAAVVEYAARLEALCLERPYNWFNFFDFWNEEKSHDKEAA